MTSSSFSEGILLQPEDSPEDSVKDKSLYRHPTVYDAVAGRISAGGFIPKHLVVTANRDTASSSTTALPPESVLFRSRNAPARYAESDIYFANERHEPTGLPESDLLKALHSYTSDYYSRATADGGTVDWKSLDETALIALGVLMEEASRDILGRTGDLVFTEGEEVIERVSEISSAQGTKSKGRPSKKRRINTD
ncbi:hypothetical protein V8E51_008225 [Hyaloscypha variabilis]|uniref:Uncharacterized protein n=1 Tax=Hyaloscypha variabilis (strain UAMH 11265 / GT02V1 / F) TaxID=1149755 RepID=A0A2J6S0T7_HYAVF|nr:hypothetical protein L207DRAFT_579324 [Hyaloscypha variabilis F]